MDDPSSVRSRFGELVQATTQRVRNHVDTQVENATTEAEIDRHSGLLDSARELLADRTTSTLLEGTTVADEERAGLASSRVGICEKRASLAADKLVAANTGFAGLSGDKFLAESENLRNHQNDFTTAQSKIVAAGRAMELTYDNTTMAFTDAQNDSAEKLNRALAKLRKEYSALVGTVLSESTAAANAFVTEVSLKPKASNDDDEKLQRYLAALGRAAAMAKLAAEPATKGIDGFKDDKPQLDDGLVQLTKAQAALEKQVELIKRDLALARLEKAVEREGFQVTEATLQNLKEWSADASAPQDFLRRVATTIGNLASREVARMSTSLETTFSKSKSASVDETTRSVRDFKETRSKFEARLQTLRDIGGVGGQVDSAQSSLDFDTVFTDAIQRAADNEVNGLQKSLARQEKRLSSNEPPTQDEVGALGKIFKELQKLERNQHVTDAVGDRLGEIRSRLVGVAEHLFTCADAQLSELDDQDTTGKAPLEKMKRELNTMQGKSNSASRSPSGAVSSRRPSAQGNVNPSIATPKPASLGGVQTLRSALSPSVPSATIALPQNFDSAVTDPGKAFGKLGAAADAYVVFRDDNRPEVYSVATRNKDGQPIVMRVTDQAEIAQAARDAQQQVAST
jgi:hypothetical protein